MSYEEAKQLVAGKVPPWQKVLDTAKSIYNTQDQFMTGFSDSYTMGATKLARGLADKAVGAVFPNQEEDLTPEPEMGVPYAAGSVTGIFPNPFVKAMGEVPAAMESAKVNKIQKAFFPWAKENYSKYGKALKDSTKKLISQGKLQVPPKEAEAIISPIKYAEEAVKKQLPKKALEVSERVSENIDKLTPKNLIQEKARLNRALSVGERSGKVTTERSRVIKDVIGKIDDYVGKNMPDMAKPKQDYAEFSSVKKVMERFKPEQANVGKLGTSSGTKILRNINKMQPSDIEALNRFGADTGINIVGPAKVASTARNVGNVVKKSIPFVSGAGATLGGMYYLLKKLTGNASQPMNT